MDTAFHQAVEVCRSAGAKYIVNTCLPPFSFSLGFQPYWRVFCYYPALGSGIPFPVPWRYMLKNIWLTLRWAYLSFDARVKKAQGLVFRKDIPYICQGLEELDFPIVVPPNMTLYGPILARPTPLDPTDTLGRWFGRQETVLFVMGTHYKFTEELARIALNGILAGFQGRKLQLLWKLPDAEKFADLIQEVLRDFRYPPDTVMATSWLNAPITSILSHPKVACFIHHGGANSYFESAFCGVPQVILAQWFDLYDNATREEYLGIGVCGNSTTAPKLNVKELEEAVAKVTTTESFRRRAEELGILCRKKEGRARAADFILEQGLSKFPAFL